MKLCGIGRSTTIAHLRPIVNVMFAFGESLDSPLVACKRCLRLFISSTKCWPIDSSEEESMLELGLAAQSSMVARADVPVPYWALGRTRSLLVEPECGTNKVSKLLPWRHKVEILTWPITVCPIIP